eukprot:scaffold155119_cov28-Tisochrysis_lutea.AAC.2
MSHLGERKASHMERMSRSLARCATANRRRWHAKEALRRRQAAQHATWALAHSPQEQNPSQGRARDPNGALVGREREPGRW